jgi:transposase
MLEKQLQRLREKLRLIDESLRKRPQCPEKTGRRIGRWLGRNTLAEKVFKVEVEINAEGKACALQTSEESSKSDWANHAHGAYLLRTNCLDKDPQSLWRWYIQLTQAEEAFRCCKSDLGLRPVFHHTEDRVQAHILVCFLSLVLWRSFEMGMQACGLGSCARQALMEIERIRSMDVVVPVKNGNEMHVRLVSKPDTLAAELLRILGLKLPSRPKIIENVVEKNGPK